MRIVYPESRRFRISFVVERVCRSANTGCPVPSRGPDFLCRIRSCGLPRVRAAAFSRTGPGRGREGVVSGVCMLGRVPCPYNLQACADMPGQGYPSGGAPGAGASSLPATDSISLFFSRHRRRKRGCVYPLLGLPVRGRGRGRPSRRVFRRPLRRGGRALPGRTSEDMVSYDRRGRAPSLRRRDASGMPNEIVSYLRYAVHHGFSGGRSRFSNASRSPLRQRIFPQ